MLLNKLREISNPYQPITARLTDKQFVGREDEKQTLFNILSEYRKSSNLSNILISGEKTIGKSSLLCQYNKILQSHNFVVFEVELPRDPNQEIDPFEFFKSAIDYLFEKLAPTEGYFFDVLQSEIWFSLTSNQYKHDSNFLDRKLKFATKYANKKKGVEENLTYQDLFNDFSLILDELISKDMDIEGLAILVDEFQELHKSTFLLESLRKLSDELTGLIIVGAGLPSFYDIPIFEKFIRSAIPFIIKPMNRDEILDLIFNPIEETGVCTRHEIKSCFNFHSIMDILHRSSGNPLHVNILCSNMFDYFKKNSSSKYLEINRQVMENVMKYYSMISTKSHRINRSLESCRKEQLKSFSLLFKYEGFSIKSAILLDLAFNKLDKDTEEIKRKEFIDSFQNIWELGLFEFKDKDIKFEKIQTYNINRLSQIEYKFVGNPIDKLYAFYVFEDLTKDILLDNSNKTFEDMLANRYAETVDLNKLVNKIPKHLISEEPIVIFDRDNDQDNIDVLLVNDLSKLANIPSDKCHEDKYFDTISNIRNKYPIDLPAIFASMLGYKGYYIALFCLKIRGRTKILYSFYPVLGHCEDVIEIQTKIIDVKKINEHLSPYLVEMNYIFVYWIPAVELRKISIVDISKLSESLFNSVSERNFERAIELSESIRVLRMRFEGKYLYQAISASNDYAFCLVNLSILDEAKKIFEEIKESQLISKINYANVLFFLGHCQEAKLILSKIVRKQIGKDDKAKFMHLALNHENLEFKNRIAEDTKMFNIAAWNSALINAFQNRDQSSIFSFLKKVKPKGQEELIHLRVKSWIKYYENSIADSIKLSEQIIKEADSNSYIYDDAKEDLRIFSKKVIT